MEGEIVLALSVLGKPSSMRRGFPEGLNAFKERKNVYNNDNNNKVSERNLQYQKRNFVFS